MAQGYHPIFNMPKNPGPEKGEQATVGLKSDLKTLQQLTSSAEAAKKTP